MVKFIMLCGIPGSGKSTLARKLKRELGTLTMIVCPDKIREDLYGDESIQGDGKKVFEIAYGSMVAALKNGINVIFDATNVKAKDRKNVLKRIEDIKCKKYLYYIPISVEEAMKRQEGRERKVPIEVVQRMYDNFQEPSMDEGWTCIEKIYGGDLDENGELK